MSKSYTRTELALIYRGIDMLRTVLVVDFNLTKGAAEKAVLLKDISKLEKLKRKLNAKRKTEKLLE